MACIRTKRDVAPDGTDFIGVGFAPDIEVVPTVAAARAGRDEMLERAVAWLCPPRFPFTADCS